MREAEKQLWTWSALAYAGVILLAMAFRMTVGVDLSDESYYMTFLDDWLKHGIGASKNLVLHQTAELLVYPLAKTYTVLRGSETGLCLFLRFVYLAISCTAALSVYLLMQRIRPRHIAVLSAVFVVSFIPFSLPAPSYNSVGMCAMLSAVCLFGVAYLAASEAPADRSRFPRYAVVSGAAWAIATVAYPTLAIALALLVAVSLVVTRNTAQSSNIRLYAYVCAAFECAAGGALVFVYGWGRLVRMFRFSNAALEVSNKAGAKTAQALSLLLNHPWYSALAAAAVISGIYSASETLKGRSGKSALALTGIFVLSCLTGPVLFFRSHDIEMLLVLSAMFSLGALRSRTPDESVVQIIYVSSLAAGLITALTATNGIYNFPVGSLAAAIVSPVLLCPVGVPDRRTSGHEILLATAILICTVSSFLFVYGEFSTPMAGEYERVPEGVFAGLLTSQENAIFIENTTELLAEAPSRTGTIVVFGRLPGVYLLTGRFPSTLSTWRFDDSSTDNLFYDFYRRESNQPDLIVNVVDQWTSPLRPPERLLLKEYKQLRSVELGSRSLSVYEHATGSTADKPAPEPMPSAPAAVGVHPESGSGTGATFAVTFSHPDGFRRLQLAGLLINATADGANACYVTYDSRSNALLLVNDSGSGSRPATFGSGPTDVENSQCSVSTRGASAVGHGTTLTVTIPILFKPAFAGRKHLVLFAESADGKNSGLRSLGEYDVLR